MHICMGPATVIAMGDVPQMAPSPLTLGIRYDDGRWLIQNAETPIRIVKCRSLTGRCGTLWVEIPASPLQRVKG